MKWRVPCVLFLGLLLAACTGARVGGDRLAWVNGDLITKEQLGVRQKIYELFFRQMMDSPASRQQLLDQMITERLLLQQSDRLQVKVTDTETANELERFFLSLDRQYGSRAEVTRLIQEKGLTNDMLAGFIKEYRKAQAVVDKKKAEVSVTPEEVRAYYDENRDRYFSFGAESARAAHVLLPADQGDLSVEIARKAKAGGDFGTLARQYSVDPVSARVGGDLGYFTRGVMVNEVSDTAFTMEVGAISDPVRSQFGWHVIHVLDRQGPGVIPFERARENAANRLLPMRQDAAYERWLQELTQTARIQKVTLSSLTDG